MQLGPRCRTWLTAVAKRYDGRAIIPAEQPGHQTAEELKPAKTDVEECILARLESAWFLHSMKVLGLSRIQE